jgi:hypothetical protein
MEGKGPVGFDGVLVVAGVAEVIGPAAQEARIPFVPVGSLEKGRKTGDVGPAKPCGIRIGVT